MEIGKKEILAFGAGIVAAMLAISIMSNFDDKEEVEITILFASGVTYAGSSANCDYISVEFTDEFGVQRQIIVEVTDETWSHSYIVTLEEGGKWPISTTVESVDSTLCYVGIKINANGLEIGSTGDRHAASLNATAAFGM